MKKNIIALSLIIGIFQFIATTGFAVNNSNTNIAVSTPTAITVSDSGAATVTDSKGNVISIESLKPYINYNPDIDRKGLESYLKQIQAKNKAISTKQILINNSLLLLSSNYGNARSYTQVNTFSRTAMAIPFGFLGVLTQEIFHMHRMDT